MNGFIIVVKYLFLGQKVTYHLRFVFYQALLVILGVSLSIAQPKVVRIQPDAIAPGMTVAFELFSLEKDSGAFGNDGIYLPDQKIQLERLSDTTIAVFGPLVVSWKGRMIQMPVTIRNNSSFGQIRFRVRNGASVSPFITYFRIADPDQGIPPISGGEVIGDPFTSTSNRTLTLGNTLIVDSFITSPNVSNSKITFSTYNPDTNQNANTRYHPIIILSRGPVRISNVELSVSADSLNGGPGGGGGGAGFSRTGGVGFTGGGSDSENTRLNVGSGDGPSLLFGGASLTEVHGGENDFDDQGGGGGTGSPFGSSGKHGRQNNLSNKGGYGGGSAGGEELNFPYGGGGGGYATSGETGQGAGDNSGNRNGGRFLVPLQGGSGGGAGNCYECNDSLTASGGGGGGAITIIGYDAMTISQVSIRANGSDGGTSFKKQQAGGGGGSGGALYFTARKKINISSATLQARGGKGGSGGEDIEETSRGGDGGNGLIRFDGDTTFSSSSFDAGIIASGPTIFIPTVPVSAASLQLTGTAGNMIGLSDSIRIYYRTSRSSWKYVDTVRISDTRWQKYIQSDFDSVLYVTVLQKTEDAQRRFANYEPEWLLSHLSSGIIKVIPRPHLVYSPDTLRLGCTKLGLCDSSTLYLNNVGSLPLTIDSLRISDTDFTIISNPTSIRQFSRDSIIVNYCPKKAGQDTAILTLFTNDSSRQIVVIGCGTSKDLRITISPLIHNFDRRKVDSCFTVKITIRSEGDDTVTIDPKEFTNRQFTVLSPTSPIKLGHLQSASIIIQYCPTDTGFVRSSVIITEQRDSIIVTGTGILKKLSAVDTLNLGVLCNGRCIDTSITIISSGNEPVRVSSITGATILSSQLPTTLYPEQQVDIRIRICPDSTSPTQQQVSFTSDADSSRSTLAVFSLSSPDLTLTEPLTFKGICIGGKDTIVRSFINRTGNDVIVNSATLRGNSEITSSAVSTPTTVTSNDSVRVEFYFDPATARTFSDTLDIAISSNGCDTVLSYIITGFASNGEPLFSRKEIDFGVIDTGDCTTNILIISNVCLSPITVNIPTVSGKFSLTSSQQSSLQINGGKSDTLIYQYCPTADTGDSLTINFTDGVGASYLVTFTGKGRVNSSQPHIYLHLPISNEVAGTAFNYIVSIDSARDITHLDSLFLTLTYDPIVVQPISVNPGQTGIIKSGSETIPGVYTFVVENIQIEPKKSIASIAMMPLLSKHTSTPVVRSALTAYPNTAVSINEGSITVARCEDPPTNIVIPGDFSFELPSPNPASANILLSFEIGAEGRAVISVTNSSGSVVLEKNITTKKGMNEYHLDLSSLPSGRYSVAIDSWGWRETKPVVIIK
jgi:hypothetical protein